MTYPITPTQSTHNAPPRAQAQNSALLEKQIQAMGDRMGQAIAAQLLAWISGQTIAQASQEITEVQDWFNQLPTLMDQLWQGLTSIFGIPVTPTQVGSATAAQTETIQAISAAVATLTAQLAGATAASDNFQRVGNNLGANWNTIINTTPIIGGGFPTTDGSQIVWSSGGLTDTTGIYQWIGTNQNATTDITENGIVLGIPLGATNGTAYTDILARMNSTATTFVRARVGNTGSHQNCQLIMSYVISGVETVIGTVNIPTPAVGSIIKLYCGTAASNYQFQVVINNDTYTFNDSATASQVGATFRGRGCGQFGGSELIGQYQPGSIADWQANDITAPPGVVINIDGGDFTGTGAGSFTGGDFTTGTGSQVIDGGSL